MSEVTFEAGRLLCRPTRDYLNEAIFRGMNIKYLEGSGIFSRKFTVIGDDADVAQVARDFQRWAIELEKEAK